ncbi:MAG: hypothetical protein EOM24_26360, partial [Chloroflexia bacterium]|nr:hypothetical protein [Chloroflexia bacterium]
MSEARQTRILEDMVKTGGEFDTIGSKLDDVITATEASAVDLAAIEIDVAAIEVDLAAIELINTDIKTATEASAVDLAAIELINADIKTATEASAVDLAAIELINADIKAATEASAVDLAAIEIDVAALEVDLAAIELINADIKTATEASAVDLAAIEIINTAIQTAVEGTETDVGLLEARASAQEDTLTGFHTTIDGDHRYIHDGLKFNAPIEVTMAQDDIYKLSFLTPTVLSGKYVHWRPSLVYSSGSALYVRLYEDVSSGETGSAVTAYNMNRGSATTSASTIKEGVTADVSAASPIAIFAVGAAGGPQSRSGGAAGASEEIVLK